MSRATTARRALPAITLAANARSPVGHQIFRQLRDLIRSGRLRSGLRLPSTRQLAAELRVSRNTVVFAFEELQAEGYIVSVVGAGSYVAASRHGARAFRLARPIEIDQGGHNHRRANAIEPGFLIGQPFEIDLPAIDVFPQKLWAKIATNRCTTGLRDLLRCADTGGYLPLRQAIAEHLRETRGIECEPDQVIVVTGQAQAISLASAVLIETGEAVLIENPTHLGIRQVLSAAGARLVPISVDREGFDIASACGVGLEARFALVTPSRHFPLGPTMSPGRRASTSEWVRAGKRRWVFEDDTGHDLTPHGSWQAPLWSSAAGQVIYFSSFRPTLAPSLRLGFMIVPEDLVDAMLSARMLSDGYRPPLEQAILTDFIVSGGYAKHIRAMQHVYAERHVVLAEAVAEHLSEVILPSPEPAGLHTICRLSQPLRDVEVAMRTENVFVVRPLSAFYDGPTDANALLLGHAPMNPVEIRREVRRLAAALR